MCVTRWMWRLVIQLHWHRSAHLVSDVIVSELQDVPRQIAHGIQGHGAVLEEMSAFGEGTFKLDCPWSQLTFDKLLFPYAKHKLSVTIILEIRTPQSSIFAYLATFLLDSLLPALDGEKEQQEKWSGREKRDRGKRHYLLLFVLSTPHPSLCYLRAPETQRHSSF